MSISDLLIPIAIAIIMFGIGLTIRFKDFKRIVLRPRPILAGLVSQMFFLPLLAFILFYFWPIDPIYKMGFILIAACPGGTASNLVTFLLRGSLALSISLTAFTSLLIVVTIPLVVQLASAAFLHEEQKIALSFLSILSDISMTVLLPAFCGLLVNEFIPSISKKLETPLKYILPAVLFSVFAYVLFFNDESSSSGSFEGFELLFIPALILNVVTMLVGYLFSKKLRVGHRDSYTIAIQVGLQNSALAIFISDQLGNHEMAVVAIVYGSFTFFTTWLIAWWLKTRGQERRKNHL